MLAFAYYFGVVLLVRPASRRNGVTVLNIERVVIVAGSVFATG